MLIYSIWNGWIVLCGFCENREDKEVEKRVVEFLQNQRGKRKEIDRAGKDEKVNIHMELSLKHHTHDRDY